MGVTSLWSIVQPCARPTKIETLNRKRLAVDASIWIYQFLKAVRDKEGNALRNSHVVGFFRRICKLLFFGIQPVFVFDGGAPALKRSVIRARKQRREGRRDDAARTAGKLLAMQMQRRAEEEDQRRREEVLRPAVEEEAMPEEGLVYVDELQMSQQERQQNRKFRKKDAYHLPELDMSMNEMGGPNDPRVMSLEELQNYARQFEAGEDINVYDFSKIDYDSSFFMSLPASDRYNILNAARLRSRLRMGHSKEQLDSMFPDRMAFSKFQIERVTERNELTQRLMHINGGDDAAFGINGMGRVAGEKGREYVLVKNDGVEGGWALGVVSNEGTTEKEAIDVDKPAPVLKQESDSDDEDFEDVAIEGLNRLPKQPTQTGDHFSKDRQAFYKSRRPSARRPAKRKPKQPITEDPDSLFVAANPDSDNEPEEEGWENVEDLPQANGEDEELNRAIALSLQQHSPSPARSASPDSQAEQSRLLSFHQSAAEEARPIPRGGGRAIANIVNKRAFEVAPESREVTSFGVPALREEVEKQDDGSGSEEEAMDFQAALAESRKGKKKTGEPAGPRFNNVLPRPARANDGAGPAATQKQPDEAEQMAKKHGFSGPLPFESLDLGSSLLGKKKMQQRTEEAAGGFVNGDLGKKDQRKAEPLPPWFSGDLQTSMRDQRGLENEDLRRAREERCMFQFAGKEEGGLRQRNDGEVIDLDADDDTGNGEVIDLDAEDTGGNIDKTALDDRLEEPVDILPEKAQDEAPAQQPSQLQDEAPLMGDLADVVRAKPPTPREEDHRKAKPPRPAAKVPFIDEDSKNECDDLSQPVTDIAEGGPFADRKLPSADETMRIDKPGVNDANSQEIPARDEAADKSNSEELPGGFIAYDKATEKAASEDDESMDWSESEDEATKASKQLENMAAAPAGGPLNQASKSPSAEFEDIDMTSRSSPRSPSAQLEIVEQANPHNIHTSGLVQQDAPLPTDAAEEEDFFDDFDDPEDEEMLRALAQETEEHARFASELNPAAKQKTTAQNIADYEAELKQLRSQQKKDRRDADEVTHIMITECQQLLRLFGLPYITAPMEAEAQCAELVRLGLVDGIVTDDSDCFLFGGTRIYENFFNQAKFVECYLASDLEKEFDLTRQKLIQVAHLLGSDYTEGLPGVGPVTALEILGEFSTLSDFKDWWTGVQTQTIPKSEDVDKPFRKKFRRNALKLFLPPVFPDTRVDVAYEAPEVDSDPAQFQWGVPDLDSLRNFLMATIGWTQERTDEVLVPVIRDMNRRRDEGTQSNITRFFNGAIGVGAASSGVRGEGFAPRKKAEGGSKRMGGALKRMAERAEGRRKEIITQESTEVVDAGTTDANDANGTDDAVGQPAKPKSKPKSRKRKQLEEAEAEAEPARDDEDDGSEFEAPKRKTRKSRGGARGGRGRGKKTSTAA